MVVRTYTQRNASLRWCDQPSPSTLIKSDLRMKKESNPGRSGFIASSGFVDSREALQLVQKEEQKLATRSGYRTSARTLRKLAGADDIRTQR